MKSVILSKASDIAVAILNFMLFAEIGNKRLKPKYRRIWYAIEFVFIVIPILIGIMNVMETVTNFINWVYWGIPY